MSTHTVLIDGVEYRPQTRVQLEAMTLLHEVYAVLWAEAFYDPYNDQTRKFAKPLAEKMMRVNELLRFKK